jgi:hypothetical protein
MKKSLPLLIALLFVVSCGGGGGDGQPTPVSPGWTGPVNAYNYPDVKGKYTIISTEYNGTCTDGSEVKLRAENLTAGITQSVGNLVFYNIDSNGNFIYQGEQMTGQVDLAGNFNSYRDEDISITDWPGVTTMKSYFNGKFTEEGWSGTIRLELHNAAVISCTLTASFAGDLYAPL